MGRVRKTMFFTDQGSAFQREFKIVPTFSVNTCSGSMTLFPHVRLVAKNYTAYEELSQFLVGKM